MLRLDQATLLPIDSQGMQAGCRIGLFPFNVKGIVLNYCEKITEENMEKDQG